MNFPLFKKWFTLNITERNLSTVASVEDDTEEKASKCELQSIKFPQPTNSLSTNNVKKCRHYSKLGVLFL